jgi:hypothetical protein
MYYIKLLLTPQEDKGRTDVEHQYPELGLAVCKKGNRAVSLGLILGHGY